MKPPRKIVVMIGRKRWHLWQPHMYAKAVVGSKAVLSYFHANNKAIADKSLHCLEKKLLLLRGCSMRQQTLTTCASKIGH